MDEGIRSCKGMGWRVMMMVVEMLTLSQVVII
jgi:hypothetical protein